MSDPLTQQFAAELLSVAQRTAANQKRSFRPAALQQLQVLAQAAAAETIEPFQFGDRSRAKASLDLETRKGEARKAFERLVGEMAAHAVTLPGYPDDQLGKRTLGHANSVAGLCPCWPIC